MTSLPDERGTTRWCLRPRMVMLEVKPSAFFFSLLLVLEIFYNLHCFVVVVVVVIFLFFLFL